MKNHYLIQECSLNRNRSYPSKGIDKYFTMEYMGAAEFEFGALPTSLKRIRNNIEQYVITKFSINKFEKNIWIYSKKEDITDIKKFIEILGKKRYPDIHLKSYSHFYESMSEKNKRDLEICLWLDIDNDFFFSKTKLPIKLLIKGLKN